MRALRLGFFALAFALGCSASPPGNVFGTGGGGSGGTGATGASGPSSSSGTMSGTGGEGGGGINIDGGQGGGTPLVSEVFAHSASVLYKLDPDTKVVTTVGSFTDCVSAVIDIALDKDGKMFGTTFGGLYRIEKTTAVCTLIALGGYPNSLSFVPKGTLDPNEEVLVGYQGSTYVRIDTMTGSVSDVGQVGGGYSSSGDIVSVIGGGTYLTVNGAGCGDCIIEVNPSNGSLVKMIGPVNHGGVYGLAFWGGVAYGFDSAGTLFEINLTNGSTVNIPTGVPGLSFYGAGSTTAAPLKPPT